MFWNNLPNFPLVTQFLSTEVPTVIGKCPARRNKKDAYYTQKLHFHSTSVF